MDRKWLTLILLSRQARQAMVTCLLFEALTGGIVVHFLDEMHF